MAKIFAPRGIDAKGKFLETEKIKLFSDVSEFKIREDAAKQLIEKAEGILNEEIPFLSASLFREYFTIGRRTHNGPMFRRREHLFTLFMAEMCEDKGRFTERIIDYLWAIMEESSWMQAASYPNNSPYGAEYTLPAVFGPDRLHGIDLFSPACAALLAIIHHYMKDKLDAVEPIVDEKILYSLNERIIKPYLHCTFWWNNESRGKFNNWAPWITSNVLTVTALTNQSEYVRDRVLSKALATIDIFVNGYGADGGCEEGPSYWAAAGGALFDCLEIIYDITGGEINVYDDEMVRLIGEYIYKVNISGERYVNFADAAPNLKHNGYFIYRFGKKCDSRYLMSFGQKLLVTNKPNGLGFSHPYRAIRNLLEEVEANDECVAPTKVWLPDLCIMARRENEITDKGMYFVVKGGCNGDSHNHNDTGSFMVYYAGNPVLIDPGVGEYTRQAFSAGRYDIWQMQSHYHNLPAFDGAGQKAGGQYKATDVEYDEEKNSLKFELATAYPVSAGIISYTRKSEMNDGIVKFTEDVKLDSVKEIDFRYISPVEPTLLEGNRIQLAEGRVMTYDEKLTAEIEKFGTETVKAWGEYLWRIHLKATAKEDVYTVTVE